MQRSCITSTIYFALLSAAYYLVTHLFTSVPFGFDLLIAGGCALFTGLVLTGMASLWTGRADYAALSRAERAEPLQDGRMEAAIGVIQPLGEGLISPFQNLACVAYTYKIYHIQQRPERDNDGTSSTTRVTDFSGLALAPTVIQTPRGPIRLAGFNDLDAFNAMIDQSAAMQNAEAYVANTDFEEIGGLKTLSTAGEMIKGATEGVRKDWRMQHATLQSHQRIEEQVIQVGQLVTALGYYSAEKGALVPSDHWNMMDQVSNRVYNGDGRVARKKLAEDKVLGLVVCLIGALIAHAVLVFNILHR